MKKWVVIKSKNVEMTGAVERIEGSQIYIQVPKVGGKFETFKFHVDEVATELPFIANEVQAKAYEKATGIKVPAVAIAMTFTKGNAKLNDTKAVSFYQWNMNAVTTCPWRTQQCEANCYALKAERMYPSVKTRRTMNTEFSNHIEFIPSMIEQIEFELAKRNNQGKTIFFRIHESGDFYDYGYSVAWHHIAKHFKGNRRIVFMAYTKSLPLVKKLYADFGKENVNIVFKSSIWEDTKQKFVDMTQELGLSVFTAEKKGTLEEKNYFACPSSETFKNTAKEKNCGDCKVCYLTTKDVAIEIH